MEMDWIVFLHMINVENYSRTEGAFSFLVSCLNRSVENEDSKISSRCWLEISKNSIYRFIHTLTSGDNYQATSSLESFILVTMPTSIFPSFFIAQWYKVFGNEIGFYCRTDDLCSLKFLQPIFAKFTKLTQCVRSEHDIACSGCTIVI